MPTVALASQWYVVAKPFMELSQDQSSLNLQILIVLKNDNIKSMKSK